MIFRSFTRSGIPRLTRSRLCIVLLLVGLFIWTGRPRFLFSSHLLLPWLTRIEHVQPLVCQPTSGRPSWPHSLHSTHGQRNLTVVIVTARPEFQRLPLTMAALLCHLHAQDVAEVMFLVPPHDAHLLRPFLTATWPWPMRIQTDDRLLKHTHVASYRLQMIFKLFLAQIIQTEFYLILDSDCVAVWPIHVEQLLHRTDYQNQSFYRAVYQIEGRSGHEKWWSESEQLLQARLAECSTDSPSTTSTMGVTPSILSRSIALTTLCRLQKLYGDFLPTMANWALWRLMFGGMWTEYTLYFLTARCTNTFDTYHVHHSNLSATDPFPALNLYGHSIWSSVDWTPKSRQYLRASIERGLEWRRREIEQAKGQAILDTSTKMHSLFTVLQGRHSVDPVLYHENFYPLFIEYLKQQKDAQELIVLLNTMSRQLR